MKEKVDIYYKWIPEWLKFPLLLIAMFPHLMILSLFHSNTTFTASFLNVEIEDIQYFLSLSYAAVVATLLIFPRLLSYFRIRSYILIMSLISITILLGISITNDPFIIGLLRILEGIFCVLEGACFLPLLMRQIKHTQSKTIAFLFLYAFMLTGSTLTTALVKNSILDYGWSEMIKIVLYWHLIIIGISLIIFNNNRLMKKQPLYQLDLTSYLFLLCALCCGSYVVIFGRKLYWFENSNILISTAATLISSALFILRQKMVRRPVFHFEVLKYKNVIIGVILVFFFYIIRAGLNNVYSIMSTIWGWPWEYIANIQFINTVGTLIGIAFSGYLLITRFKTSYIFIIGFLLLSIDCFWFVNVFYTDSTVTTIGMPLFLQGFGQGWLFTPLVIYIITGVDPKYGGNPGLVGTSIRFWSTHIGFALISNATYYFNQKNFIEIQKHLDSSNPMYGNYWEQLMQKYIGVFGDQYAQMLSGKIVKADLMKQAILLSNMEIFTYLGILSLCVTLFIILAHPSKIVLYKLRNKILYGL